jgi:phosphatidylinositol dimannoside acyltransferase
MRSLARVVGTLAYYVDGARRHTVYDNLARIAPNVGGAQRRRLARRTFRNLASTSVDLFRLPSATPAEIKALFEARGREHLDAALSLGRGVIIVTAHLSAYELGGAWSAAVGYPVHAMVEDLEPEVFDALASYRRATGMGLISMRQGVRTTLHLLRDGQVVLLVADRAVGDVRNVSELPFGAGTRPVPTGPAMFAIGTGAPVIVGHVALNPARHPRYLVEFEPPLYAEGQGEDERLRLTRRITERLAAAVQDHPDEWYVFQPQWVSTERE